MDRKTVEAWRADADAGVSYCEYTDIAALCDALLEAWDDGQEQARIVGSDIVVIERLEARVRVLWERYEDGERRTYMLANTPRVLAALPSSPKGDAE